MDSFDLWTVLGDLNPQILIKISKIIIFGENGSQVIFSTKDGKVYGFGTNSFGELGVGHKHYVTEPKNIVGLNDKQIVDFCYGFHHVLAKTINGKLYSWGYNSDGQLGIGTQTSDYRPNLIHSLSDKCVIKMSCGSDHTLVLTDDLQLYGFGYNNKGQIGCGNNENQLKPIKINVFNNENIISISCGFSHSLALTQTGNVFSWGYNHFGELGIGHKIDINIPIKINVSHGLVSKGIVGGKYHSLILSECGDVYAFGSLGTGHTSCVANKILGLKNVKEIASHFYLNISMAKLEDNSCYVWGLCMNGYVFDPKLTKFQTFNDIIALYSKTKITVKPIECFSKSNLMFNNNSDKFNDKEFSDIVFKVGNKLIFVNKFVLRLNSNYFRNKYSVNPTEIRESSTESVNEMENIEVINDYSYEVFYAYLKYLYTQSVEIENQYLDQLLILSIDHKEEDLIFQCTERLFSLNNNWISSENIVKLMKHAIDNNMIELKVKCIQQIKNVVTFENICNVFEICVKYGLTELEKNCFEMMRGFGKNNIIKTQSYKKMSKDMRLELMEKL